MLPIDPVTAVENLLIPEIEVDPVDPPKFRLKFLAMLCSWA
jgi:hypothetical protein